LSLSALVCYVFITVLLYVFIHNVYRRYYSKQQQALLDQTHKELTLKELENNKRLLDLKNEKLEIDIQSKNRELAVSTMSLIKKNEFLNTVKNQIVSVSSTEDLKRVVKVIDNNINNTDDWKLFEKAFNNADKDFLKLIKDKHPSLTPNDLRLCAYLRLNLSSKEIAPLLNISPRSVEVKRYRLRKKMNLPHEFSLTSYIIDL
jgi:DNA-binding CsgD family transcriptional regulator